MINFKNSSHNDINFIDTENQPFDSISTHNKEVMRVRLESIRKIEEDQKKMLLDKKNSNSNSLKEVPIDQSCNQNDAVIKEKSILSEKELSKNEEINKKPTITPPIEIFKYYFLS